MSQTQDPERADRLSSELGPAPESPPAEGEQALDVLDVCRKLRTKLAFTPLVLSSQINLSLNMLPCSGMTKRIAGSLRAIWLSARKPSDC